MQLIYFYSRTCRQCRLQAEEFDAHPPSVDLRRVWIYDEAAPSLMRRYSVHDVPTTVLVDDCGKLLHSFIDYHCTVDIEDWIARH